MADNNKVTIDAAWFAELYAAKKDKEQYAEALSNIARERDELKRKLEQECASCPAVNERDELKAKLQTAQNYEAVIAAKDREIEGVKEERNRLNAKVNELMKQKAAAEHCIEECSKELEEDEGFYKYGEIITKAINIIRAWREKRAAR